MAQAKHTFVESKMNKDLDDRLLSGGQYRNAINVAVSKSEQSDVGALENVLGNYSINNFFPQSFSPPPQLDIIGWFLNDTNNTIYVFLTNYSDPNSPDSNNSQFATSNSSCFINQYNIDTGAASILVEGSFLNFSTTNRISGVNLIEDFLFWTDNRNQPRKINVSTALQNTNNTPRYYVSEDTISVAKYNPYLPIQAQKTTTYNTALNVVTVDPADPGKSQNLELETYNDNSSSYGSQDCLDVLSFSGGGTEGGWRYISGVGFDTSNINLYTWFVIDGNIGQVFAKKAGVTNGFYAQTTSIPTGSYTSITFLESNIIDTTSPYLPPSGRLKVTNPSSNQVTTGVYEWLGNPAVGADKPINLEVEWLSGGTENVAGTDTGNSSQPLGLFMPISNTWTPGNSGIAPAASEFYITRGLKLTDSQGTEFWQPVKISSNHFNTDTIRAVCGVETNTGLDSERAFFGTPRKEQNTGSDNWDIAFEKSLVFPGESTSYFDFSLPNPYYNPTWSGDKQNLKEKFVRFAYRFKFDDDEYSLVSPFTQAMFIPQQDGYFYKDTPVYNQGKDSTLVNQLEEAGKTSIVDWFENKGTEFLIDIPLEYPVNQLNEKLKVVEVDILYKESDALALKVVDSIDFTLLNSEIASNSTNTFSYQYNSAKPYKVLPDNVITRTSDKVPVKALAQETSGNRVMYGNFLDKHSSPLSLQYSASVGPKFTPNITESNKSWIQYPNHTVKQNRTYQIGVVLSDRYGRQSDVILAPPEASTVTVSGVDFSDSSIYHGYKDSNFVVNQKWNTGLLGWRGDSLKVLFEGLIPTTIPDSPGYPGLYNGDPTSPFYNPVGYYTYKIVVKQKQQDYYNVYLPSLLWGQPVKAPITLDWVGNDLATPNDSTPTLQNTDKIYGLDNANLLSSGMSVAIEDPLSANTYNFTVVKIIDSTTIQISPSAPANLWGNYNPTSLASPGVGTSPLIFSYQNSYSTDVYLPDSMSTTLLSDNINKIPPDLETIRPNQTLYRTSDLEIIPRVARALANQIYTTGGGATCEYDFAAQLFPGEQTENVISLGNYNDIIGENDNLPTGLYDQSKNPVLAILSNKLQIGSAITDTQFPAVFETAPTESQLDIFWETGTTGLISALNQDIITGPEPVSLVNFGFTQNESVDYTSTPDVIWSFSLADALGGVISQGTVVGITLASVNGVVDSNGVDVTSDYSIGSPSLDVWQVTTNKSVVFKGDDNSNKRKFTLQVEMVGNAIPFTIISDTYTIINAAPVLADQVGQTTGTGITPFTGFADVTLDVAFPLTVSGNTYPVPDLQDTNLQYRVSSTNGSAILTWPGVGDDQYDEVVHSLSARVSDSTSAALFNATYPKAGFSILEMPAQTASVPYTAKKYALQFTWDGNIYSPNFTGDLYLDWRIWDCNNGSNSSKLYSQVASANPGQTLIKISFIDSNAPQQITFQAVNLSGPGSPPFPNTNSNCFGYPGTSGVPQIPNFTSPNNYDFLANGGILLAPPGECT